MSIKSGNLFANIGDYFTIDAEYFHVGFVGYFCDCYRVS
jgi:hypothetical protein